MSAKKGKRKLETKTLLYILLVIVIIGGGYVYITTLEPTADYYYVGYVLENSDSFIENNQTIIVEGYLDLELDNDVFIVPILQDEKSGKSPTRLKLDYSNIENFTTTYQENVKYHFTGTLKKDESDPHNLAVIFVMTGITDSW